jgi:hypothetical protein
MHHHHLFAVWVSIGVALFVTFAMGAYAALAKGKDTDD